MTSRRVTFLAILTLLAGTLALPARAVRDLTFEDRVDAQRAIERVYYHHQIATQRTFEAAVGRDVLERKVRGYLAQSEALERVWRAPIRAEQLDAELARIVRSTRFPERLRELFRALGDDPLLVRECLVRPVLVDRLVRSFLAGDRTIQESPRREADSIFDRLASGRIDPGTAHPRRTIRDLPLGPPSGGTALGDRRPRSVPEEVGRPGPVIESRDAFTVEVPLSRDASVSRVAVYSVPKVDWDEWSMRQPEPSATLAIAIPASSIAALPPLPDAGSPSCVPDDTWS
ncbi:MAG: hypothetical protein LAO51_17955, partial [Acidobacteriia bacterium]|nr:hypothetical protein [Terriglobia bacterium]